MVANPGILKGGGGTNNEKSEKWACCPERRLIIIHCCKTKSCNQIMHTNVLHRVTHKTISLQYIYEQHTCNFAYSDSRKALASGGSAPDPHSWKYFDTRLHEWPHQLFIECAGPVVGRRWHAHWGTGLLYYVNPIGSAFSTPE